MLPNLPIELIWVMLPWAGLFSKRVWIHVQVMVVGALLAPGKRTVTSILRIMGLSRERHFQNYHRVLNRAKWSSLEASRILLKAIVGTFNPLGPIVMGLDDTIERRKGDKIKAKGIYRDPVRSCHTHFVKTSGLRWLSLMLLVEIPWAGKAWALPFLTALAPSERYDQRHRSRHKKLTDWGRQMLFQVRRWLPQRELIVTCDSSFAALEFLNALTQRLNPIQVVTRLRLDAALYEPASPRTVRQMGRPRLKGKRLPNLSEVLENPQTTWQTVTALRWYSEVRREVEITSGKAVSQCDNIGETLTSLKIKVEEKVNLYGHASQSTI